MALTDNGIHGTTRTTVIEVSVVHQPVTVSGPAFDGHERLTVFNGVDAHDIILNDHLLISGVVRFAVAYKKLGNTVTAVVLKPVADLIRKTVLFAIH